MSVHAGQENKPKTTKDSPAKSTPKPQTSASKKAPAAEKQNTQSGVVVAVDPTTRRIRPPTPEQMRALGQRGTQPPNVPLPETQGPGGAVNVQLGPEFQTYTVVTRAPDGKVQMEEVNGEKAAKERIDLKHPKSTDGK